MVECEAYVDVKPFSVRQFYDPRKTAYTYFSLDTYISLRLRFESYSFWKLFSVIRIYVVDIQFHWGHDRIKQYFCSCKSWRTTRHREASSVFLFKLKQNCSKDMWRLNGQKVVGDHDRTTVRDVWIPHRISFRVIQKCWCIEKVIVHV